MGQAPSGDGTSFACVVDCDRVCGAIAPAAQNGFRSCSWTSDGKLSYLCGACGVGRVAAGTALCPPGETVADRLAHQAYYEAASVVAFERLVVALERAGAPRALIARACAAANDEARHAALFSELAQRHGVAPIVLDARPATPSLFELALENATEGCVRETFGAIVTLHQAQHAESEEVRAAFAAIADDEAEHAALSWELKTWFDTQLTPAERSRVQDAHDVAVAAAHRDAATAPDAPGVALGLPSPARAEQMLGALMAAMAIAA